MIYLFKYFLNRRIDKWAWKIGTMKDELGKGVEFPWLYLFRFLFIYCFFNIIKNEIREVLN